MTLLMTACAGAPSSPVRFQCPPLTRYDAAFQAFVAAEKTEAERTGQHWPAMVNDYGRLRAECRAIGK